MKFRILIFAAAIFATASQLVGQSFAKVNINNVSTFVWNDGRMDISPKGNAGFEYWKGTKRFSVFASGVYWGGYIDNELRIGGTKYRTSLKPGNEFGDTIIYKVRPDYKTASLSGEINDEGKSEEEIRARYEKDYNDWPVKLGAPFFDVDQNGLFRKGKDIPGFPNADQTLWQVCNDFEVNDYNISSNPFYSKQTNVELQITTWAYSKYELLKGVVFKSYKLINKSKTQTIKDVYLGIFTDPDLGDGGDDFAGCDTTLGLGYIYNSRDNDSFWQQNLGAYGCLLLQSPIVNGSTEECAIKNGQKVLGNKNLGMTSFTYLTFESCEFCPIEYSYQPKFFYNTLQGLSYLDGRTYADPVTRKPTKFLLSGNPVAKTGFIDGILGPAYDRNFLMNSGPFNMAPGDTQEVIIAQIVTSSTSRLGSVSYLKYLAKYVKDFYMNGIFAKTTDIESGTELPTHFSLEQNYPNPFNPETTISYTISASLNPSKGGTSVHVTLKVYDVLGREVTTLVDEIKQPGKYVATFNSRHLERSRKMSSGVYFYILQAGEYISTKKMVLLK
ncbi:MAG: hypothetical protein A2499_05785 [Stygiobacter sp. RIFOXYC12_FULL_38_8]|nr:MAG: hypothetical protein A2X62_15890 [Stygiobacter sp. GWC2_38_9]OGV08194.1 MAG: hypothetical protein A2299_09080 [Stygiobacter sp. RIFOXYB2_FULL_37_11]OGV09848.1 MAG: hypothetical protein A2237_03180 [Stygiobacter sp. RIFOXYA2_FULL_38_8]OGV15710.1 MAG: hypothetical protein A2440_01510 [Stygiobacter sp. RIFOXYC2_FULL_38_25]OGV22740.1 MAG: hypothetical protein A2499_05785 [Stygiobacter sp. RIFOXYC12_FULL_38_8]OGV80824.1 MAG: hypothetical protein A2X65_06560 [Stygiobacter sp. GWF2_38_21]